MLTIMGWFGSDGLVELMTSFLSVWRTWISAMATKWPKSLRIKGVWRCMPLEGRWNGQMPYFRLKFREISQVDKIFGVFFSPKIWEKVYMPQERRWKLLEAVKGLLRSIPFARVWPKVFFLMVKTNVKQASWNLIEDFELCILDVYYIYIEYWQYIQHIDPCAMPIP